MASFNKWIGLGNLGRDPEIRWMPDGKCVANISIACSEKYKDKHGEQREITEWVNITFFGKLAEIVGDYLIKGSTILVEGKIRTEKYTDKATGVEKYSTKIIAESMQMCGGTKGSKPQGQQEYRSQDDDIPY